MRGTWRAAVGASALSVVAACAADGSDPGLTLPEFGVADQLLVGVVGGAAFGFGSGLAPVGGPIDPLEPIDPVGLYQEPAASNFRPMSSYIELVASEPGRYRIADGFVARFVVCPEVGTFCARSVGAEVTEATEGLFEITRGSAPGTLSGGARLEDEQGNSVDGRFSGVQVFTPACGMGEVRCQDGQPQSCTWDLRGWEPCTPNLCERAEAACSLE